MKVFNTILFPVVVTTLLANKIVSFDCAQTKNNKIEQLVLSRIKALPEVKLYLQKNLAENAALMVSRQPDADFKYYWIKLGIGNLDMFRTADDFYVDPKTFEIYYVDMMNNSGMKAIPLQLWRRWRSDTRFWKIHTFKKGKIILI